MESQGPEEGSSQQGQRDHRIRHMLVILVEPTCPESGLDIVICF